KNRNTEGKEPFAMTDDFQFALDEQAFAQKRYPELDKWKALAKWLATDEGKRTNAAKNRDIYAAAQRRGALGDGDEVTEREQQRTAALNGPVNALRDENHVWQGAVGTGVGYAPGAGA